ncbi:MAG: transposase [Terricaulis sp.]
MSWKKHSAEEIVGKLDHVRAMTNTGFALSRAIAATGVSKATYFRWRAQYQDLDCVQVAQLKQIETHNARLRRALRELEYDQAVTA